MVQTNDFDIYAVLDPQGVGVIIECQHMCMVMRGVQKSGAITTTSSGKRLKKIGA